MICRDKIITLTYINNLTTIHNNACNDHINQLTKLIKSIATATDILSKSSLKSIETLEKIDYHLKNWCIEEVPDNIDNKCIIIKKTSIERIVIIIYNLYAKK